MLIRILICLAAIAASAFSPPLVAATALQIVAAENLRGCSTVPVGLLALDASGDVDNLYANRVVLNASVPGNWRLVAGNGQLEFPAADGQAAYTFVAADHGRVQLAFAPANHNALTVSAQDSAGLADVSRSIAAPSYEGFEIQQGLWETRYTWNTNTNAPPAYPEPPNLPTADSIGLINTLNVGGATHPGARFSLNWLGTLTVPVDGDYIFHATVDEGTRVMVDGAPIIDEWTFYDWRRGTTFASAPVRMYAGIEYDLKTYFFERWGPATLDIRIQRVGDPAGAIAIPATALRACASDVPTLPQPLSHYKLDESTWSGTIADVIDSIGGFNGIASAGMAPDDTSPALTGARGSCGYGEVPADNDIAVHAGLRTGVRLAADIGDSGTVSFWYRAPTAWNAGVHRTLLDASENSVGGAVFFLGLNVNGGLVLRTRRNNGALDTQYSWTNYGIAAGQWANVVLRWNFTARTASVRVFDTGGGLIGSVTNWSLPTNIVTSTGTVFIGDNATQANTDVWPSWWMPVSMAGPLDEVRIYRGELTTGEMEILPLLRHNCSSPDHFAISHAGTAVNCEAANIGIAVHAEDHTVFGNYTGTIDLGTSSNHGDWELAVGNGVFSNSGNGSASYQFASSDAGQATFRLRNLHAESLSINVTDGVASEAVTEDAVLQFVSAGFIVESDHVSGEVPTQITGKPSDNGHEAVSLALKAVRTDDDTGACTAIFTGDVDVETALACTNPVACGAHSVEVNGTTINASSGAAPAFSNVGYSFNAADPSAPFSLVHDGAGEMQLRFQYSLDATHEITGASNAYVVRPFALVPEVSGNPAATGPSGTVFTSAGKNFKVRVRAAAWEAADDADSNGAPDGHADTDAANNADLSDNATVANWGSAGPAIETARLASRLVLPATGSSPALAGDIEFANYTAGTSDDQNVRFNEAGIIEVSAALKAASYLGISGSETLKMTALTGPVGRFRADHLVTEVRNHGCSDTAPFTYSAQPLSSLYVEARNVEGDKLANYSWDSVAATGFAKTVTLSDAAASSPGTFSNGAIAAADFSAGSVTLDDVAFTFTSLRLPYALQVRATDSDGATSKDQTEGVTEVRAGRMTLNDALSPSFIPAAVIMRVETWRVLAPGQNDWDVESQDSCTNPLLADVLLDQFSNAAVAGVMAQSLTLSSGNGRLEISAPGSGNNGTLRATVDAPSWLEFDWNGSGAEDPGAKVTYGELYRTEPGLIHRQEIY